MQQWGVRAPCRGIAKKIAGATQCNNERMKPLRAPGPAHHHHSALPAARAAGTTEGPKTHVDAVFPSPLSSAIVRASTGVPVGTGPIAGKVLGLYFSASWCGPCHDFTAKLKTFYDLRRSVGDFEVVLISLDTDPAAAAAYARTMPWLALHLDAVPTFFDTACRRPESIPTLLLLHPTEARVMPKGRDLVLARLEDGTADTEPFWK
jgi:thiol-disulfide isomerase/thioredoxin